MNLFLFCFILIFWKDHTFLITKALEYTLVNCKASFPYFNLLFKCICKLFLSVYTSIFKSYLIPQKILIFHGRVILWRLKFKALNLEGEHYKSKHIQGKMFEFYVI